MAIERRNFLFGACAAFVAPFLKKNEEEKEERIRIRGQQSNKIICDDSWEEEAHTSLVWDSTRKVWTHPDDGSPSFEDNPYGPIKAGSGAFQVDGWGFDYEPQYTDGIVVHDTGVVPIHDIVWGPSLDYDYYPVMGT